MDFKSETQIIGRIAKVHGINGGMVVETGRSIDDIDNWPDWAFVYIDSGLVPFRLLGDECYVKDDHHLVVFFDKINRPENCIELLGQDIYMPKGTLNNLNDASFGYSDIVGYAVVIEGHEGHGELIEFMDITGNPLFNISFEGKELLVPARDQFILQRDDEKKALVFKIPDGLVDLN
jgi:16S rRNA processing protein RimM